MRFLAALLTALLLAPAGLRAQAPPTAAQTLQDDGPYVLWEGRKAKVLRLRPGKVEESPLGASLKLDLPGLPALRLEAAPPAPAGAVFPLPPNLAAVSDAHGNYRPLVALLAAQGIIGRDLRWTFGKGHLMVLGDMFDRGPQVTEILWLLRSLEKQALEAGGRVHVLLGNHEVMTMKGDLRYLNPKYRELPYPIPILYGPDSEQGRWLRSLPVMVMMGDILFMHGGVSKAFAAAHPDLRAVNATARAELLGESGAILGNAGPLWYRGLITGEQGPTEAEVSTILAAYHARTLVLGHTTLDQITAFHEGRVFGIDAGLKDGKPGEVWLQLKGKRFRGLADGSRIPL